MYYGHFGLTQAPFRITPNTEFFFGGGNRGPILEALVYAIAHGEGIIKVTGEVGSGKTMLCNMLQTRLPPNIETVYLANPSVSPEEILHAIALELQLKVAHEASRLEAMQALHRYLLERHAQGRRVVIFVEESQSMPLATLEEIRLLSNLETQHDKLLQIVLFGQPELDANLRQPHIRQLRERITHSFRLTPLTAAEIREYLMFRLRAAGYRGPDLFGKAVVNYIARASAGLTRRVNLIADKALLAAFAENTHTIRLQHAKAAVRDSEFSDNLPRSAALRWAWGAALVAAGVAAAVALYALLPREADTAAAQRKAASAEPSAATASRREGPAAQTTASRDDTAGLAAAQPAPPAAARGAPEPPASATSLPGQVPASATPEAPPPTPAAPAATAPGEKQPSGAEPQAAASAEAAPPQAAMATPAAPVSRVPPAAATGTADALQAAPGAARDLLEQRLKATREWLAGENHTTYSIQLFGTGKPEQLKNHLNVVGKFVEMNKVFVYRTIAKQKPSLTVLYGSFSDRRSAREALAKLPASLKAYRPILRTVQGIRAEIKQHQTG
ncbi:MAG: AAA family ATPase [Betaproteobacteria bacterium]|nr:AAA family ATPase [Betaproteobacteria bacterium]